MNPEDPVKQLSSLTERQREVLRLVCDGLRYKTIGEELFITESTVKAHMGHIYMKLGIDHLPIENEKFAYMIEYCLPDSVLKDKLLALCAESFPTRSLYVEDDQSFFDQDGRSL